jgi:iodotyrosine deiodinase
MCEAPVDCMDGFIPLQFDEKEVEEMLRLAEATYGEMKKRRTTRQFSDKAVPKRLLELAIKSASTAPSGAHLQPWTFAVISNQELKQKIRVAAEEEELKTYQSRMPDAWAELLEPLGTDHIKEHITTAPWLVILFKQNQRLRDNGEWGPTYYATESVGIAAGMFISAIHKMGLCTLTHTPSPMGFLRQILERPEHESAMLLMPVGYPAEDAQIPDIQRKSLDDISIWFE